MKKQRTRKRPPRETPLEVAVKRYANELLHYTAPSDAVCQIVRELEAEGGDFIENLAPAEVSRMRVRKACEVLGLPLFDDGDDGQINIQGGDT